jgi:hypothetical protein
MTSDTCLNIRPANFGTRVQPLRFPKYVSDISSGVRYFFSCALRVRPLCGPCAALVRSCAALCGVVRCCAVLCVFCEADGSTPSHTSLPTFALQIHESCIPIQSATALISFEAAGAVNR